MTSGFCREGDANCALWVITQQVVVISYRRFGTTYRSHLKGPRIQKEETSWPLKMRPKAFPKRRQGITTIRRVITQKTAVLKLSRKLSASPHSRNTGR